jgi:glycerophosphoryl diester phosphodiesterase
MVQADSLHGGALVEAMEAGQFYASTGVELSTLHQTDREIGLRVKTEAGVHYKIQFIGVKKGQAQSTVFKEISLESTDTSLVSYTLKPDEWFVRAKIISDKLKFNPYFPQDLEMAWTQPLGPRIWPTLSAVSALPNAHAHNDYEHNRPLLDALSQGFTSVEADVFLLKDSLYVNHNRPFFRDPARTLENMYLKPLREQIRRQGGRVYQDYKDPFYLFIDLKTEAETTYQALAKTLNRYRDIIQVCIAKQCKAGPVQVILSGNRPIDLLGKQAERLAAIDGRPVDLGKGFSTPFMPIVSDNYRNHLSWNGQGEMPAAEKEKLQNLVKKVHSEGKKLRLWASPENENVWRALREAGVDLINTDRLEELRAFLEH